MTQKQPKYSTVIADWKAPTDPAEYQKWWDGLPPDAQEEFRALVEAQNLEQPAVPEATPEPTAPGIDAEASIKRYIQLRAAKADIAAKQKTELDDIETEMKTIEGELNAVMVAANVTSLPTAEGTATNKTLAYVDVKDWDSVLAFITEHGATDLLPQKVKSTAVIARMEAEPMRAIPGLEIGQKTSMSVTAPTAAQRAKKAAQ